MEDQANSSSESDTSCLNLSYSSSDFENELDSAGLSQESGVKPYCFEPEDPSGETSDGSSGDSEEEGNERLSNLDW